MKYISIASIIISVFCLIAVTYNNINSSKSVQAATYTYPKIIEESSSTKIWVEDNITCENLSQQAGVEIHSIQKGDITTGYNTVIIDGKEYIEPIIRRGVIIEFSSVPDSAQLEKLDIIMSINNMKREGGTTITDKLNKIESEVNK